MTQYEKYESKDRDTNEETTSAEVHHYYEGWSCMGPAGSGRRTFNTFWGVILLGTGGAWLAANIWDIDDWGQWAWSVILIALGVWYLARAMGRRSN